FQSATDAVRCAASRDGTVPSARVASMAPASPGSPASPPGEGPIAADPLPLVRLELLHAAARPTTHEIADAGFLICSVPGCDLRLPGADLPPVLCLITRDPSGVTLRKLAPVQSVLLNGRPVSKAVLGDGDRGTVGALQLRLSIEATAPTFAPPVS